MRRESIARWQAKVGKNEAERVKNVAAARGTKMHSILEGYILGKRSRSNRDGRRGSRMANTIIDKGLPDLDEIWALR